MLFEACNTLANLIWHLRWFTAAISHLNNFNWLCFWSNSLIFNYCKICGKCIVGNKTILLWNWKIHLTSITFWFYRDFNWILHFKKLWFIWKLTKFISTKPNITDKRLVTLKVNDAGKCSYNFKIEINNHKIQKILKISSHALV